MSVQSATKVMRTRGSFSSQLTGHVVILNLLKRFRLLTTGLLPATVEDGFADDSWPRMWSKLAKTALGREVSMMEATRGELWAMAKYALEAIDGQPSRCDWYPVGWLLLADIVRGVRKDPGQSTSSSVKALDTIDMTEAALRWVMDARRMSEDAVLLAAGLERPLQPDDETTLLNMMRGGA